MKAHVLIVGALLTVGVARIHATTISVTNTNDSGPGSLRSALASAANGDTINFSVTGTILLTSGELLVSNSVNVIGPGPNMLAVYGNNSSRVFHIAPSNAVRISSLTISNGHALPLTQANPYNGGGIYNDSATLTLSNVSVSGNSAFLRGGGIYSHGFASLEIVGSILSGNSAYEGGGIDNDSAAVRVVNSTLSGNHASIGGGAYNSGTLEAANSTLSSNMAHEFGGGIASIGGPGSTFAQISSSTLTGNSAEEFGGGIASYGGSVEIANSTLSDNSAEDFGGGIDNGSATLTLINSTLSKNSANAGGGIANFGDVDITSAIIGSTILKAGALGGNIANGACTVTSLGYNLSSDDGGGFLTAAGDQVNTDPMLGPLQDNGGPTFTHALLPGSPAIDAGDPNFTPPPDFDQRGPGFPRVVGCHIDIGAFEVQETACSPAGRIDNLISLVQGLGLPAGPANSLSVKLEAAASALGRGNIQAACGSLGAFLNEVNAQKGKKLTVAQANLLVSEVTRIRAVLGC